MQTYVPGYRLLNEPQFDDPSINSGGQAVVTTFVEVDSVEMNGALPCRFALGHVPHASTPRSLWAISSPTLVAAAVMMSRFPA